ncbi:MAG TPA: efflux RND transporter periplasmic adaptor subunit [Verrucomicrobiales bacterium]|nr:efflux RND transporter periplasmic adaptor subunit [Verrucomicrobiales bacterium]
MNSVSGPHSPAPIKLKPIQSLKTSTPGSLRTLTGRAVVLLSLVAVTGCKFLPGGEKKAEDEKKEQAIPVEVATIQRGPIESTLKSSWYLEAEQEIRVLARTSNRLRELLVEEGSEVKKDQVLARLEDHEQRTSLAKAQNQLAKMKAEFERLESLYTQKLVSEQAFTDMKFELRQLELTVEDAARQLEYTEVKAPISGTITRRLIKLGDLVSNNQHLFDMVDFESIVAYVAVPDRNLVQLRIGQPARITTTALPGRQFEGFIKRISPIVEARTGTVKVTIGVMNNELLRPGMYVEVEIVLETKTDALLISKRALVYDSDQLFVYRLKPERRVERLLIVPALTDKLNIEPASGFAEGDQIVVAGHTGLKDGALVRLPDDPDPKDEEKKVGTGTAAQQAENKKTSTPAS